MNKHAHARIFLHHGNFLSPVRMAIKMVTIIRIENGDTVRLTIRMTCKVSMRNTRQNFLHALFCEITDHTVTIRTMDHPRKIHLWTICSLDFQSILGIASEFGALHSNKAMPCDEDQFDWKERLASKMFRLREGRIGKK